MLNKDWSTRGKRRAVNIKFNKIITIIKFRINEGNEFNLEQWKIFIV